MTTEPVWLIGATDWLKAGNFEWTRQMSIIALQILLASSAFAAHPLHLPNPWPILCSKQELYGSAYRTLS
jgi:hypothetical protein